VQYLLVLEVESFDSPAGIGEGVVVPHAAVFPALKGQLPQLGGGILDLAPQSSLAYLQGPDPRGALNHARGLVPRLRHSILRPVDHVDGSLKKIHDRP
jgi:hypothetical protein